MLIFNDIFYHNRTHRNHERKRLRSHSKSIWRYFYSVWNYPVFGIMLCVFLVLYLLFKTSVNYVTKKHIDNNSHLLTYFQSVPKPKKILFSDTDYSFNYFFSKINTILYIQACFLYCKRFFSCWRLLVLGQQW